METLITKEIDGHPIVTAIDEAIIDPEATKKNAIELLHKTEIYRKYTSAMKKAADRKEKLTEKIEEQAGTIRVIEAKCNVSELPLPLKVPVIAAKHPGEIDPYLDALGRLGAERRKAIAAMDQVGKEIRAINAEIAKEHKKIREENPIFFEPRKGEIIPTKKELDKIKVVSMKLKPDQAVTPKGEIVQIVEKPKE